MRLFGFAMQKGMLTFEINTVLFIVIVVTAIFYLYKKFVWDKENPSH